VVLEWLILGLVGVIVGFAGGYAGIGGAPFLVTALVIAFERDQHLAQGTVLAVMLGPMSLPGVVVMWDRVRVLLWPIALGVLSYAIFSNLGARLAFSLHTSSLEALFGLLLTGLGVHYLIRRPQEADSSPLNPDGPTLHPSMIPFNRRTISVASALIGVVGGLFGIGAGVLMVPLLISFFGLHKDDARAMSLAILLPPVSIGAILEYHVHDGIDWRVAGVLFVTYFVTNYSGARLGRSHETGRFLYVMGAVLGALGVVTIYRALF